MILNDNFLEELRLMHVERGGSYTWAEIVQQKRLPLPPDALRKRIRRYELRRLINDNWHATGHVGVPVAVPQKSVGADVRVIVDRLRSAFDDQEIEIDLDDLLAQAGIQLDVEEEGAMYTPYPTQLDDTGKWLLWQEQLAQKQSRATVMVWSDIHFPDQDENALDMALAMLKVVKPDALVHAGDMFDFDALSTFAKSRRRNHRDALQEVENSWHNLIDRVSKASPKTKQIAFRGNHDSRLDRWSDGVANPFADSTEAQFVQMVRSRNRVWWLGQLQETFFGDLLIQHGKRVGENAAKNACRDQGWATPVSQGHNHRPGVYIHRVNDARDNRNYKVIMSSSSGCLCNIPPSYQLDTNQATWLHGINVAHVDFDNKDVHVSNVVFHRLLDGTMWTMWGNERVESRRPNTN